MAPTATATHLPGTQGLEGREAVTVVVDDSHSVWAQHRRNLVVVERYVYFPASRVQLGIARPSLLEANRWHALVAACRAGRRRRLPAEW